MTKSLHQNNLFKINKFQTIILFLESYNKLLIKIFKKMVKYYKTKL